MYILIDVTYSIEVLIILVFKKMFNIDKVTWVQLKIKSFEKLIDI